MSELVHKQAQDFEKNIKENSESLTLKIGEVSSSLKSYSTETTGYINGLRTSISDLEKSHSEKIASVVEGIHKLEVPVALNTQGLTALTPKVETLQVEVKAIPLIQNKLEISETNTNNRFGVIEKSVSDVQSASLV